jgi:hypothetical protein
MLRNVARVLVQTDAMENGHVIVLETEYWNVDWIGAVPVSTGRRTKDLAPCSSFEN